MMSLVAHESAVDMDEKKTIIIVKDLIKPTNNRFSLILPLSISCSRLHNEVSKKAHYVVGTFDLVLTNSNTNANDQTKSDLPISNKEDAINLMMASFSLKHKNYLEIREKCGIAVEMLHPSTMHEESETTSIPPPPPPPPPLLPNNDVVGWSASQRRMAVSNNDPLVGDSANASTSNNLSDCSSEMVSLKMLKLVGLVNQAMTCYLNSLIQTLYMTPEFRNAMYKWESNNVKDTSTSIPYQLQHLFLMLQTSDKQSVETTGLTKSFGWDSSEAWQQHDIQELCRVMFDALEKKFEGTEQADLIKQLYEGKMKDYVQCCECGNESARDDTFLDVPITIRPFGSTKTYKSVIEGLNAFVESETLDESNQYYCEKCEKKCDAKKGLKFTKFPYLLTLQLKRFDFDYSTMHRIKLNDRMSFPQILNLNSFIEEQNTKIYETPMLVDQTRNFHTENGDEDSGNHDSGNDFEATSSVINSASGDGFHSTEKSSSEEEGSSVDEGIDIDSHRSTHKKRKSTNSWWMNNEDEEIARYMESGPYVYELFSIMVHSGSAAGGHYYAYIKSFENNRWYSFNDQIVSPITYLDIEKTFGGSQYSRSYYSSFSSSSTNAYMLMYRQINPSVNAGFIPTEELPPHILQLLKHEEEEEKLRQLKLERERNMCSIRLFCRHPSLLKHFVRTIVEETFEFHKDLSLPDAVGQAHAQLKLNSDVIPVERCRLVKYDHINDVLDRSYDLNTDDAHHTLSHLLGGPRTTYLFDLLLETREEDETFERYERGGVTIKIFVADHDRITFQSPILLRSTESHTVQELKEMIAERVGYPVHRLLVAYEKYSGECRLLHSKKHSLKDEGFFRSAKVYVDLMNEEELESVSGNLHLDIRLETTFLWTVIDRMANVITVNIALPPEPREDQFEEKETKISSEIINSKMETDNLESTSSSDEGVGSLGGGSRNGGSPDLGNSVRDTNGSADVEQDVSAKKDLTPSEINYFWKIPESSSSDFIVPSEDMDEDCRDENDELKGRRQRNNSYDDSDRSFCPDLVDFQGKLKEKLEDFATCVSPTSSLRCEDGDSSQSGPDSVNDVEFDDNPPCDVEPSDDYSDEDAKRALLQTGSDESSLSASCSTLDSTDTLCNTTDPSGSRPTTTVSFTRSDVSMKFFDQRDASSSFTDLRIEPNTKTLSLETSTNVSKPFLKKSYPGRVVTCDCEQANSDYLKALQYVDGSLNATNKPNSSSVNVLPPFSGTGDPSDLTMDSTKTPSDSEQSELSAGTSEPAKTVAWDENVTVAKQCNSCGASDVIERCHNPEATNLSSVCSLCQDCSLTRHMPTSPVDNLYDSANVESFKFSELNSAKQSTDPDSGEGNDKQKALFSESSSQTNNVLENLNSSQSANATSNSEENLTTENARGRTVSGSSTASDGWGISSDALLEYNYFQIISTSQSSLTHTSEDGEALNSKVITVEIDKRMKLLTLKRQLSPMIGTPTRRFCIYKQYAGGQEVEMATPTDNLKLISNNTNFIVRLGRALRRDEYRCKLYRLVLDDEETSKLFMNWVVQRNVSVEDACKLLSDDMAEQCAIQYDPKKIRLRKKTWKSPGQVFLPSDVFGSDISLYGSLEFFLEFLDSPEPKTKRSDLVLLCRRWYPSHVRFGDFEEVILSETEEECVSYLGYSVENLVKKLASITEIPEEHIKIAKGRGVFPYRISVLSADDDLEWMGSSPPHHFIHFSEDGTVVFYKDSRELMKELSEEEREMIVKEELKSDSVIGCSNKPSSSTTTSPSRPIYRREKALKIYTVDTTPSGNSSNRVRL